MNILISERVQTKLNSKHGGVTINEIRECFANLDGRILIDTREDHVTNPYTRWFIAETNCGRELKVAYIPYTHEIQIKTAYEPDDSERNAYREGNK